jgi:16S rRNA (guanine527-N7)-methyltransferase
MQTDRIAELLQPFLGIANDERLTANDLQSISTYIDILLRWNARINLTAIRDPEQIVARHFGESLFAARHLFPERSAAARSDSGRAALQRREKDEKRGRASAPGMANDQRPTTDDRPLLADVGSGAGFPGIPIKLWAPDIALTLIESNHKKATFLREVARSLTLTDINIQNTRAESLPNSMFDVVTLRAVERFESVLPVAANLVAPHGKLVLLIGAAQQSIAQGLLPQLSWRTPNPIPESQSRILLVADHKQQPQE